MSIVKCLNATEKANIVSSYNAKFYTQQELANMYLVSKDTIYRVLKEARNAGQSKIVKKIEEQEISLNDAAPSAQVMPFIWNANSKFISITQGRETWNADKDHPGFANAFACLAQSIEEPDNEQYLVEMARDLINVERAVKNFVKGNVTISDGTLYYQNIEIRSGLTTRILDSMAAGEDFEFYLPFLENLLENPSQKAVSRLFDFLVANDIKLTEDGYFIGWKIVREDYTDCRTGTFDNSPGKLVKMPRTRVNDNDEVTCSHGLHVCSKGYIGHYGHSTSRIVSVKVHPRDVVSIPVDYGDAKMRTCQYEVLEDVTDNF